MPVTLIVGCGPGGCLAEPQILGVVNGASFQPGGAPRAIMTIFGTGLSDGVYQNTTNSLPTQLGPTTVTVNGLAAPLFYVGPTPDQLPNAQWHCGNAGASGGDQSGSGGQPRIERIAGIHRRIDGCRPRSLRDAGQAGVSPQWRLVTAHTGDAGAGRRVHHLIYDRRRLGGAAGGGRSSCPLFTLSIIKAPVQVNSSLHRASWCKRHAGGKSSIWG